MKRNLVVAGKALISLCLLGWFFTVIEPRAVLETLALAAPAPLCLAALTMLTGLLVSVSKWWSLLRSDGIEASFTDLTRYYLIGIYFNNFLPTSIGGDAMRAWLVSCRHSRGVAALSSVLAERLSGLLALLLIAGAFSFAGELFPAQAWFGTLMLLSVVVICWLPRKAAKTRLLNLFPHRFRDRGAGIFASLHGYCTNGRTLWAIIWTSLIYPFLVGLVYFWGGQSLGLDLPLFDLIVVTSLVTLLTVVPISLNGLGLREGGFIFFLGLLDVPQAQALSLSLLVFSLTLMFSLVGGVCLLIRRGQYQESGC